MSPTKKRRRKAAVKAKSPTNADTAAADTPERAAPTDEELIEGSIEGIRIILRECYKGIKVHQITARNINTTMLRLLERASLGNFSLVKATKHGNTGGEGKDEAEEPGQLERLLTGAGARPQTEAKQGDAVARKELPRFANGPD